MAVETAIVAEFPTEVTGDCSTPFILYANVYGAVPPDPVNVTFGEGLPIHTDVVPLIDADGSGFTTTAAFWPIA